MNTYIWGGDVVDVRRVKEENLKYLLLVGMGKIKFYRLYKYKEPCMTTCITM